MYQSHTGKCFIVIPNHRYVITWFLQIISYQIKDYTRDQGSIGLLREWCFGEEFGSKCLGLFLLCFCLVRGGKVTSAQDFGWWSKGEDHFKSWFPFLVYLWQFCTVQIMSSPKTFLYISFVFFRSLIGNFLLLLPSDLWSGTFFSFPFSPSEGKDGHSHPGSRFMVSWDFGSRLVERLDTIYVRVLVWPTV